MTWWTNLLRWLRERRAAEASGSGVGDPGTSDTDTTSGGGTEDAGSAGTTSAGDTGPGGTEDAGNAGTTSGGDDTNDPGTSDPDTTSGGGTDPGDTTSDPGTEDAGNAGTGDAGPFVRREVGELGSNDSEWDPVMEHYALAVRTMQSRPSTDPTSWAYQAGIHGFSGTPQRLFNECQHQTWFFLPWHRLYLYRFEQIVRQAVIENGGPSTWALPFWDYENNGALPWVLRQPTMEDGTPNPLFVSQRNSARNNGTPIDPRVADSSRALAIDHFGPLATGSLAPTFGGASTAPSHFGSFSDSGALELSPHNGVHVEMGGWMLDPNQAAQDPVFWLHHCNIDRLWEVWNRLGNSTTDEASYEDHAFGFFDATGNEVATRCGDAVDIEAQLNYTYEGLPEPSPRFDEGFVLGGPAVPAEKIGASDAPVVLGGAATSVDFTLESATSFDTGGIGAAPQRTFVRLENVTAETAHPTSYLVVIDMGTPDDTSDDHVAGVASFFGVEKASATSGATPPHGMNLTYEITAIVDQLEAEGLWDGDRVKVTFQPIGDATTTAPLSVGSVSIFVE